MSKETVYSIMFTLLQRHEDAAKYYRQLKEIVSGKEMTDWIEELAEHRESMAKTVREFIENSAPVPVRNKSREATTSVLHKKWDKVEEAANHEKWLEIIHICREAEESISKYYQDSLGSEGIAEGIRDLLQQQHKKIIEVNRRAERFETVPGQEE